MEFKIRGGVTLIDESDFELVNQFDNWKIGGRGYAVRFTKDRKLMYMHRLILGLTERLQFTDHKNHNRLDNTRNNIRVVTPSQNAMNVSPSGRSKYRGVSYQVIDNRYGHYEYIKAKIRVNGRLLHVGTFKTEEQAALAWNEAAKIHFGEFANLNIV